jgi:hypothetical protein
MAKTALMVTDAEGKSHILLVNAIKSIEYERGTPAVPAKPAVEAKEGSPGRPSNGPGDPGEPPTPAVEAADAEPAVPAVPDQITVDGVVLNMTAQAFLDMINS